jgi:mono/diheme cytochrome c family protein
MTMKNSILKIAATLAVAVAVIPFAGAQGSPESQSPPPPQEGVVDFLKPINPDPYIQHAKEIYILNGCPICHGITLHVANGDSADLLHSRLVGIDTDGKVIAKLLTVGIPLTSKLSPMPQYSDLSESDKIAIARYMHYARMEERYKELMARPLPPGDVAAGKTYFESKCASCHTPAEATALAKKAGSDGAILKPVFLTTVTSFAVASLNDTKYQTARSTHQHLAENYSAQEAADLLAYVKALK